MIKAIYNDKEYVLDLLFRTYQTSKGVNYVIKQDEKKLDRLKVLLEFSFERCWRSGEIYFSDNRKGVIMAFFPDLVKKKTVSSIKWDLKLILHSIGIGSLFKVMKRESIIRKNYHYPKSSIILWYLGVEPEFQGKGIGSSLLREITKLSVERNNPMYFETAKKEIISFYKNSDFQLFKTLNVPYDLYMFKKDIPNQQVAIGTIPLNRIKVRKTKHEKQEVFT
jgi:hypothetical protein